MFANPRPPLRLPVGRVAVLLGPACARADVLATLDDATARCGAGHDRVAVRRLRAAGGASTTDRLDALATARAERPVVLLVDRFTEGLSAGERRRVLAAVRGAAEAGTAVLVDDPEPVAALAYADVALRVGGGGAPAVEELDGLGVA
jgi:hypothetical protein